MAEHKHKKLVSKASFNSKNSLAKRNESGHFERPMIRTTSN